MQPDDAIFNAVPVLGQLLQQESHSLKSSLIASLAGTIIGMVASQLLQSGTSGQSAGSQRYQIATRFKQFVKQHYKELKQVLQYAELLNITPLYLNEAIKDITGFPASHWIQQEIVLEAKRLLYYAPREQP